MKFVQRARVRDLDGTNRIIVITINSVLEVRGIHFKYAVVKICLEE